MVQCARLDPFSDDYTTFSAIIQDILRILASGRTLAVMLSRPISSLSAARSTSTKRDTTLEIASFQNFRHMSGHQSQFVCRRLFASGQSMHQLEDPDLSCQPCRLVFVETLWIAKFDQQVRCFGHSPPCFWSTLEDSHSSCLRRTTGSHATGSTDFSRFRERHKHLLLHGNLTQ